jgi:CheY-like chemotaxis protein
MTQSPHVLLVEDDREIRKLVSQFLGANGIRVATTADGREMDQALKDNRIDLLVLDIMLPGEDGLSICRRLRASSNLPVIMLTAKGEDIDRIVGLEIGADDYLTKPFNPRELLARVRAVLRRGTNDAAVEARSDSILTLRGMASQPPHPAASRSRRRARSADWRRVRPAFRVLRTAAARAFKRSAHRSHPRPLGCAVRAQHRCTGQPAPADGERTQRAQADPDDSLGRIHVFAEGGGDVSGIFEKLRSLRITTQIAILVAAALAIAYVLIGAAIFALYPRPDFSFSSDAVIFRLAFVAKLLDAASSPDQRAEVMKIAHGEIPELAVGELPPRAMRTLRGPYQDVRLRLSERFRVFDVPPDGPASPPRIAVQLPDGSAVMAPLGPPPGFPNPGRGMIIPGPGRLRVFDVPPDGAPSRPRIAIHPPRRECRGAAWAAAWIPRSRLGNNYPRSGIDDSHRVPRRCVRLVVNLGDAHTDRAPHAVYGGCTAVHARTK